MDKYWKIVAAAAKGELTKSGVSMREWYIQNVRPDAAALADFDAHVKDIQSMQ
jgi:DNA/RNA endonuclease G (NUC1)